MNEKFKKYLQQRLDVYENPKIRDEELYQAGKIIIDRTLNPRDDFLKKVAYDLFYDTLCEYLKK